MPTITIADLSSDLMGEVALMTDYYTLWDMLEASDAIVRKIARSVQPWQPEPGDEDDSGRFGNLEWESSNRTLMLLLNERNEFLAEIFTISGEPWKFSLSWVSEDTSADFESLSKLSMVTEISYWNDSRTSSICKFASLITHFPHLRSLQVDETFVWDAVSSNDVEFVRLLLKLGNFKDLSAMEDSLMPSACDYGNVGMARLLARPFTLRWRTITLRLQNCC